MQFIFATHNENKVQEIRELLPGNMSIASLRELNYFDEIEETETTIEGNSALKAQVIWAEFNRPCFAEDTGLEVEALNNEPGIYSARYAGTHKSDEDNINKLLSNLTNETNRSARFRTVITLIINGVVKQFEGTVNGTIINEPIYGGNGFGYDPVFQPIGYDRVFAEMKLNEKSTIDHRGKAFRKMVDYLIDNYPNS